MPMTGLPAQSVDVIADLAQPRAVAERTQIVDAEPTVAAQFFGTLTGLHSAGLSLATFGRAARRAMIWATITTAGDGRADEVAFECRA